MRVSGESAHLERLTLEAFQSGLSWLTILNKRPRFREAFAGFDADVVAAFVAPCETVLCEAESLTRLCENVTGTANKRSAARWLAACICLLYTSDAADE